MTDAKPQLPNWSFSKLKQDFHSPVPVTDKKNTHKTNRQLTQSQLYYSNDDEKSKTPILLYTLFLGTGWLGVKHQFT